MANVKISQLNAASALTGSEVVPVVQGGTTKKVTTQAIAALAGGGGSSTFDITTNGRLGTGFTVSYADKAVIPLDSTGTVSYAVKSYASFNYFANAGSYGYGTDNVTTATSISFGVTHASDFNVSGSTIVQNFSFPELLEAIGGGMGAINLSGTALTNISFPKLVYAQSITIGNTNSLQTLSFPSLENMNGGSFGFNGICGLTSLTSANLPVLKNIYLQVSEPGNLQTINLPSIQKLTGWYYSSNGWQTGNSALTTLSFANAIEYSTYGLNMQNHYLLANVTLGTVGILKKVGDAYMGNTWNFMNCALTQTSIDNILTLFASLDGTNGTTVANYSTLYLNGGNNAAPSSTGLAAKDVLLTRGWSIQHN